MYSFVQPSRALAAVCIGAVALVACSGGHSSSGSVPVASPSPTATASTGPIDAAAFLCPTSTAVSAAIRSGVALGESVRRRMPSRRAPLAAAAPSAGQQFIAVIYDASVAAAQKTTLAIRESTLGTTRVSELSFPHTNRLLHILAVPTAQVGSVESALRQSPGVRAVGPTGTPRYASSAAPYWPNDPYFDGFSTTTGSATPTYEVEPLVESADVPGQWDMHVIRLEYAFGYSQSGNTVGANPNALGLKTVKLAMIDTGQDTTHPELAGRFAGQGCFITNPATGVQSKSAVTTDPSGHGTNVAGIAGAQIGNGLGFAGAGGDVALVGYRIFPTPNDSCTSDTSTDPQCESSTTDIVSAINDAVNVQHVNVISLSLGGGACTSPGVDPDTGEGAAISEAIKANVIVVAAAGNNDKNGTLEAPACDTGVIAVGATALADGTPNGSGKAGGASSPFEYVASYSDYGTPNTPSSATSWGIVAPGGDPSGSGNTSTDADNLHWINNIWTSTPFDNNFAGTCTGDYPAYSGTYCQTEIAGTSMATPHVAGAAALILSVSPAYQSPAQMSSLLCTTAADIGDAHEGCGRLDVYRAMATALNDNPTPAPSPSP